MRFVSERLEVSANRTLRCLSELLRHLERIQGTQRDTKVLLEAPHVAELMVELPENLEDRRHRIGIDEANLVEAGGTIGSDTTQGLSSASFPFVSDGCRHSRRPGVV